MTEEQFSFKEKIDIDLDKKREEARVAMGGEVADKKPIIEPEKFNNSKNIEKEITADKKTTFSHEKIFTPPSFGIPIKENKIELKPIIKKDPELEKSKEREVATDISLSMIPKNHLEAGLPKGEILSEDIVAKKKNFIIGGIIIFLLGGLFIILAIVFFKKDPVSPNRPPSLIVVPDNTTVITQGNSFIENQKLVWEGIINQKTSPNSFHIIALYENGKTTPIKGGQLFTTLGFTIPTLIADNLNDAVFGFIQNEGRDSFFILKINPGNISYENTFRGMSIWEKDLVETVGAFMSQKNSFDNGTWSDDMVANVPIRLKEGGGGIQIIYGFFDKETIIIAKTKEVFGTVSRRLRTPLPISSN